MVPGALAALVSRSGMGWVSKCAPQICPAQGASLWPATPFPALRFPRLSSGTLVTA